MAETRRDVEIQLKARDAYSGEFEKLKRRIQGVRAQGVDGGFGASATESLAKAVRLTGQVQAALASVNVITATIRGDTEGALQAVRQLPFGLGTVAGILEGIIGQFIGLDKALEKLNGAKKDLADQEAFSQALTRTREQIAGVNKQLEEQLRLARASETDRPFLQVEQALDATLAKIEEIRRKSPAAQGAIALAIQEAINRAQDLADERYRDLIRQRREEAAKEAKRQADELMSVESEILQQRLRMQGRALDAQLEAIRESFRKRIEAAREANQIELAERLRALERLQIEEAKRQAGVGREPERRGVQPLETRFLTRAPETAFSEANSAEARRVEALRMEVQRLREVSEESKETLKRIERDRTIIRVENN